MRGAWRLAAQYLGGFIKWRGQSRALSRLLVFLIGCQSLPCGWSILQRSVSPMKCLLLVFGCFLLFSFIGGRRWELYGSFVFA